ncbi:hypothetical protein Cp1R7AA1_179 [Mesorhizobium phage Cp1R7A-A1]|nr:hypothetical protein Cp1R7AA1_179 [Mesorhizobium phage Cp1R7A-A1]
MTEQTRYEAQVSVYKELYGRPEGCRNRLRDEGKPYPKSGCTVCKNGGMVGCRYERDVADVSSMNPCAELPAAPLSPLRGVGLGLPEVDLTGITFVVVPAGGYVRDPVSGKFYVGPECWAKLKGATT